MRSLIILLAMFFIIILPSKALAEVRIIKIIFSEFKLVLLDEKNYELAVFPIALPKRTPKILPIEGEILKVVKKPFWFPTRKTREAYLKKKKIVLPEKINPGDPRNAMGMAKIIIIFKTSGIDPAIRIHGTYDESSIGKRISRGCIRLRNEDILKLAEYIENKKIKVLFIE